MTRILTQVRGSLPAAASRFLRFVTSPAARAAPSGCRPLRGGAPSASWLLMVMCTLPPPPVSPPPLLSCPLWSPDLFQISLTGPISFSSSPPYPSDPLGKRSCPFFWGQRKAWGDRIQRLTNSAPWAGSQPGHRLLRLIYQEMLQAQLVKSGEEAAVGGPVSLFGTTSQDLVPVTAQGKACFCPHVVNGGIENTAGPMVTPGGGPALLQGLPGSYNSPSRWSPAPLSLRC